MDELINEIRQVENNNNALKQNNYEKLDEIEKIATNTIRNLYSSLYYDIKNGIFNSFSPTDLTNLNQEAKEHIKKRIPESGLMETAKNEALQAVLVVEKIVETIGWTLDYSALEISNSEKQSIEE